jgi:hypothetical protein
VETPLRWKPTAEIDEVAEDLPPKRRVDRMRDISNISNYEPRLWRLLKENNLADLSQFHRQGFFDEVPLYSRASDVDFLPPDASEAGGILLWFALKYLKSVVAYEAHRKSYFAAITVWNFSDSPIVPNLFVWSGPLGKLKKRLTLKAVATPFGKQLRELVVRLKAGERAEVLEEAPTLPDTIRVFLGPARPPCQGFVTLDHFRRSANAAR